MIVEMIFFVLCFGAMLVYLLSIFYVVFKAKNNDNIEEEEVQPTCEIHQKNTYNVKDGYIHKGQQLTPDMFK